MSAPAIALPQQPRLLAGFDRLRARWESGFPDIPWAAQAVRIEVDPQARSREFHFVFTSLAALPAFDIEWREPDGGGRGDVQLDIEFPQDNPGLLLKFSGFDSSAVRAIVLRQDPARIRLSGIVCLQKDDASGEWVVIYNTADRVRGIKQALAAFLPSARGARQEDLHAFLNAFVEEDFARAAIPMARSGWTGTVRTELGWLTDRFQVQANAHGLKRTFRFWSHDEKQDYLRKALDIVRILHRLTPDVCISGGAILGFQREGRLLDHDDDLDIVVGVDAQRFGGLGPTLEAIAEVLSMEGLRIKGHFFAHLWVETDAATGQTLDVFVAILEGDRASFYPSHRKALAATDLFPPQAQVLEDIEVPMPGSIEGYLTGVYGGNWRTPDPDFHHPWDRAEYADLAGTRRRPAIWTRGEMQANERRKAAGA